MSWGKCPYCGYEGYNRVYHWGTQELQCEKCFRDFPYDSKYDKQKKEQEKLEKEQQKHQQEQQNQQEQVDKGKLEKELVDKMRQPAIDMPLLNYRQGLAKSPFAIPDESVSGLIKFAETENDIPVGFDPENELHMLIVGEPGTGKTTVANFLIAPQAMEQGIKCWFFVKARDTERLLHRNEDIVTVDFDGQIKVNILQSPPNVSREVWHSSLWDIFAQAEAVYDGTKNFLIGNCFDLAEEYKKFKAEPSMFELNDFVASRRYEPRSRDSSYQDSTLNRFAGILKGPMGGFLDCSKGCLEQLVDENVIFNIGGLPSSQQVFIVNALVSWLFLYKKNNETENRHFVLIDDAMLIFDANFERRPDRGMPIINHHLAEVRKARINIIAMGQFPSLLSQGIFGTSSIKMMFTLSDSNDYDRMLDSIGEHSRERRDFARNISKERKEVIVKFSSRYTKPFMAWVYIAKWLENVSDTVSKEEKHSLNRAHTALFTAIKKRVPYVEAKAVEKKEIEEKKEVEKAVAVKERDSSVEDMLRDMYRDPFLPSNERTTLLKFTKEKAGKIYDFIENEKLAEPIYLNTAGRGGQSKFFWLTDKGYKFIGKKNKPEGSGGKGTQHIFLAGYLAEFLKKNGCKSVEIEKDLGGKKVDVFCLKDGKRIGIEICISTFKTEHINIKKDKEKCDRLIIVCTDGNSKKKLIEELKELSKDVEVFALHEFLKKV